MKITHTVEGVRPLGVALKIGPKSCVLLNHEGAVVEMEEKSAFIRVTITCNGAEHDGMLILGAAVMDRLKDAEIYIPTIKEFREDFLK